MTPYIVEVTFWFSFGALTGIYTGFCVAIKFMKYNPGSPMRIMEEHEVSRYED